MPLAAGAAPWSSCPSGPSGSLLGAAMSEAARGHRKGGHTGLTAPTEHGVGAGQAFLLLPGGAEQGP